MQRAAERHPVGGGRRRGRAGRLSRDLADAAPETTITKGPKNKTKKKKATFEFTATEPSTFECLVDNKQGFKPCSSPTTVRVKKGKHQFAVFATDVTGNVDGSPATDSWKVKKKRKK